MAYSTEKLNELYEKVEGLKDGKNIEQADVDRLQ